MLRDLFSLFPAYAGVIPSPGMLYMGIGPFPRICGGDPKLLGGNMAESSFSPHMRG